MRGNHTSDSRDAIPIATRWSRKLGIAAHYTNVTMVESIKSTMAWRRKKEVNKASRQCNGIQSGPGSPQAILLLHSK